MKSILYAVIALMAIMGAEGKVLSPSATAHNDRQRQEVCVGRPACHPQHRLRNAGGRRSFRLSHDRSLSHTIEVKGTNS